MKTSIVHPPKAGRRMTAYSRTLMRHSSQMLRLVLIGGIIAPVWYIAINFIVPLYYPGYSSLSFTVSELSAIGAPTKDLWVTLCLPFTLLFIAFGIGVLTIARGNSRLFVAGWLLATYGVIGAFWPPMHQREVLAAGGGTITDTLHIVWTIITGILMMLAMGYAAAGLGRKFRIYTSLTLLIMIGFGVLTGSQAGNLQSDLPTPLIGLWERVGIFASMIWIAVLAAMLIAKLPSPSGRSSSQRSRSTS